MLCDRHSSAQPATATPIIRLTFWIGLISLVMNNGIAGQQSASNPAGGQAKVANRLVTAKLIAITSMPDSLDRWLVDDLRAWGRYKVTIDPEGADLVIRSYDPEKDPEYRMRRGIPQPKREKHQPPPVLSITIV